MKIRYFSLALFFLFTTSVLAQENNIQSAKKIVAALRSNAIQPILEQVAPQYQSVLNGEVIDQIRLAILSNGWDYYVGKYTAEPYESFDLKGEIVYSTGTAFSLAFVFKNALLVRCYIQPLSPTTRYHLPVYADSSLFKTIPLAVQNKNFVMPGSLTVPIGKKRFPLLIYVHGSGSNDRDESLYSLKPFKDIAAGLAAKGIASLRYDKRNKVYSKRSVPDATFNTMDIETTDDANAAIKLARSIGGVDQDQIYVLGHSQGGMMLPRILAMNKRIAGGIFLSAPALPVVEAYENIYKNIDMREFDRTMALNEIKRIKNIKDEKDDYQVLLGQPVGFWKDIKSYNQLKTVKSLKIPLLFLQGERDYQVTADKYDLWKDALSNNRHAVFKLYPKLNHFYTEGEGPGTPKEYIQPLHVPAYVIGDISLWILQSHFRKNQKN